MTLGVENFPTACDPVFNLGVDCKHLVLIGHSVQQTYVWETRYIDDETGEYACGWEPADFTGYVPEAVVLDANDNVVATMTVTPSPGDDTGTFSIFLPDTDVDQALKDSAVRWRLSVESGTTKVPLIYARFKVT